MIIMDIDEYEEEKPVEFETGREDSVDNDEMDASEAAFLQGYEEDEDKSFDGESEEEKE